MNTSEQTRTALVLDYLRARPGQWVPGMELMNAEVGGTRAGARIAELRASGHVIDSRRDPEGRSDVWQYRYVAGPTAEPVKPVRQVTEDAPNPWVEWECVVDRSPPVSEPVLLLGGMSSAHCGVCSKRTLFRRRKTR